MPAYLLTSPARKKFKKHLGQANHLIITILVGLDAIERDIVRDVPKDLGAAWAPRNPTNSARRSRRLVLDMALLRAVDALDIYIGSCNSKPYLIQQSIIREDINKTGRSVWYKFEALENRLGLPECVVSALVAMMITWRNRAAHSKTDDKLPEKYREIIRQNLAKLEANFRGLDGETLLAGYDAERQPHLKEVTSFINATHQFVRGMESTLLQELDPEFFLKQLVSKNLSVLEGSNSAKARTNDRKRHLRSVWGKDPKSRKRSVQSFLRHSGLSFTTSNTTCPVVTFDDELLEDLFSKTPTETYHWMRDK